MISRSRILRAIVLLIDIALVTYSKRIKQSELNRSIADNKTTKSRVRSPRPVSSCKPVDCSEPDCKRLVTVHKSYTGKKYCTLHDGSYKKG